MESKPESCKGCPLYGDGQGFVPDRVVPGAEVALLAQNPGEDEEKGRQLVMYVGRDKVYRNVTPQPLIGATGYTLEHTFLPLAGLDRDKVSYHNVLKCREEINGRKTNKLPTGERYKKAVEHCTTAHLAFPDGVRLVVAHGGPALDFCQTQMLDLLRPLSEWRGYTCGSFRWRNSSGSLERWEVYATLHTASLFRSPRMKQAAIADWRKIPRILRGEWPQALPHFTQCPSDITVSTLIRSLEKGLFEWVPRVALDTEYFYDPDGIPGQSKLSVIGVGGKHRGTGQWVGFQVDCRLLGDEEVSDFIINGLGPFVLNKLPVVFQNAGADIPVLAWNSNNGVGFGSCRQVEDLLLLHSDLYSEQPHDLGYLASVYGLFPHTKHYLRSDLLKRNLGDVLETLIAFEKLEKEALLDKKLYECYKNRVKLVPIHTRATEVGLKVNREMVTRLLRGEIGTLKEALLMGRAYAGWPLSLGSCGPQGQMVAMLYGKMKLPAQRNRESKGLSVGKDALAVLRRHVGPTPDAEAEDREGLSVEQALARVQQGANPLLEARTIYATTIQEIGHFLAPLVQ